MRIPPTIFPSARRVLPLIKSKPPFPIFQPLAPSVSFGATAIERPYCAKQLSFPLFPLLLAVVWAAYDCSRSDKITHPAYGYLAGELSSTATNFSTVQAEIASQKAKWGDVKKKCPSVDDQQDLIGMNEERDRLEVQLEQKLDQLSRTDNPSERNVLELEIELLHLDQSNLSRRIVLLKRQRREAHKRCLLQTQIDAGKNELRNILEREAKFRRTQLAVCLDSYWAIIATYPLPFHPKFQDPKVIAAGIDIASLLAASFNDPCHYLWPAPLGFKRVSKSGISSYNDCKYVPILFHNDQMHPLDASGVFAHYLLIVTLLISMLDASYYGDVSPIPAIKAFIESFEEIFDVDLSDKTTEKAKLVEIRAYLGSLLNKSSPTHGLRYNTRTAS